MGRAKMKKMIWTPPINLNSPVPPMNYVYRWTRMKNLSKRKRKKFGFSFVRLIKLKKKNYPSIHIKNFGRCIGFGGLVLIKMKMKGI